MSEEVVVAGAGFAGINTALELAGRGYEVELIDSRGSHVFTPSVVDVVSGRDDPEDLRLDIAEFLKGTSVSFSREKIIGIDPEERVVETNSGAHSYENLVLALGYSLSTFGIDIDDAETVYSLEGAESLKERIEDAENAAVIGSGYVGVEVAGELREDDIEVDVFDKATRPMARSVQKVSELVLESLNDQDISFRGGKTVSEVGENEVVFENGESEEFDVVIWAAGMQASRLVQDSFGCDRAGLEVNSGLNSKEYSNVFAAGACADTEANGTARHAIEQAEIIAENMSRSEKQSLKQYEPSMELFLVTIGSDTVFQIGENAYRSRFFRILKWMTRVKYWTQIRWKKLKARF